MQKKTINTFNYEWKEYKIALPKKKWHYQKRKEYKIGNVDMWDSFRHPYGGIVSLMFLGHSLIRFVINRVIFFLLIISTLNWIYYLYTMFVNGVNFLCLNIHYNF